MTKEAPEDKAARCCVSAGGRGTQQRFIREEREGSAPRSKLSPFCIPFLQKGTPFVYLL